jgi:hypothetical protein
MEFAWAGGMTSLLTHHQEGREDWTGKRRFLGEHSIRGTGLLLATIYMKFYQKAVRTEEMVVIVDIDRLALLSRSALYKDEQLLLATDIYNLRSMKISNGIVGG